MPNGDMLSELKEQLKELDMELHKDKKDIDEIESLRTLIRSMRLLVSAFIDLYEGDHKRMKIVWPVTQAIIWGGSIVMGGFLTFLVTGHIAFIP